MAKVAANGKSLGKSNIVDFENIIYCESMSYLNGVFTIQKPGFYEVSINFDSLWYSGLQVDLLVNNLGGFLFGERTGNGSLNMSTIVKLNYNDKVNVRIRKGKTTTYQDANNFSIRKID